jgi:hypothetical protein
MPSTGGTGASANKGGVSQSSKRGSGLSWRLPLPRTVRARCKRACRPAWGFWRASQTAVAPHASVSNRTEKNTIRLKGRSRIGGLRILESASAFHSHHIRLVRKSPGGCSSTCSLPGESRGRFHSATDRAFLRHPRPPNRSALLPAGRRIILAPTWSRPIPSPPWVLPPGVTPPPFCPSGRVSVCGRLCT